MKLLLERNECKKLESSSARCGKRGRPKRVGGGAVAAAGLGKKCDTLGAFDFPVPASDTPDAPRKRVEREERKRGMGSARRGSGSGDGEEEGRVGNGVAVGEKRFRLRLRESVSAR